MGSKADPDRTRRICNLYKAGVPVSTIASQFGVLNPAIWRQLRKGGLLPAYAPQQAGGRGRPKGGGEPGYTERRLQKSAGAIAKREAGEPPRPLVIIDREPCFMCGTRGDIGCRHQVTANG